MSQHPHHQSLHLKNFTAFREAEFEFVPGVNVFVGENGTGKTHILKTMYATQLTQSREAKSVGGTLGELFQTRSIADLIRLKAGAKGNADVNGVYQGRSWSYSLQGRDSPVTVVAETVDNHALKSPRPAFIPAIDMMGHTKGFTEAYDEVRLDFDLTCRDVVNLLRLERRSGEKDTQPNASLTNLLGGSLERDGEGRFYLVTTLGRQPMPLVAEGLRKIATLVQLQSNGWLAPGTTLFWDEPEVNLNPILMNPVVSAILDLSRNGVQVFLATHSYVILKELDLQAGKADELRYFLFSPSKDGTQISTADHFAQLAPNPIMEEYDSLYDRELTKSTGRNRRGERVS